MVSWCGIQKNQLGLNFFSILDVDSICARLWTNVAFMNLSRTSLAVICPLVVEILIFQITEKVYTWCCTFNCNNLGQSWFLHWLVRCFVLVPTAGQNPDHVLQGAGGKHGSDSRRPAPGSTVEPEDAPRFLSCSCLGHCPEDAKNNTCM